ncbi:MAG: HAD-IIIA family hydrolase [Verrucomicrobiales bacterium]|nr:HAD-IIIA family hydrolase [Verrucomicrobiales bacterium]
MTRDPQAQPRPAVFFDRDGVVNVSPGPGYVLSWEAFQISPGLFDLLRDVHRQGWLAIIVTSQKGVGKNLMTQADLDEIHANLQSTLRNGIGSGFDGIYAYTGTPDCPHRPKPDPEMILTAAREWNIDVKRSWLIGDADRDIEMAVSAGIEHTIRVRGDNPIGFPATHTVDSLAEALAILTRHWSVDGKAPD